MTPTDLRQAAKSLSHETKFRDLRTDAGAEVPALETLFVDLVKFCLQDPTSAPTSVGAVGAAVTLGPAVIGGKDG